MDLGPTELLIVLAIALLLFGGAKLPKLARSMGEASREFKKGVDGHKTEALKDNDKPATPSV
jgi:TatA/E family protein of Tat protein translocase